MFAVKDPVPLPELTQVFDVVGLCVVGKHIPLSVTVAEPALVTFPPPTAEFDVILVTALVLSVGGVVEAVVNSSCCPNVVVPVIIVTYALI